MNTSLDAPRVLGEFSAFVELLNETRQFQKNVDDPLWHGFHPIRAISTARGIDLEETKAQWIIRIWDDAKYEALKTKWEETFRTNLPEIRNKSRHSDYSVFADLRGKYALNDPVIQCELAELLLLNRFQWHRAKFLIGYYADHKSSPNSHQQFKEFILDPDDDEVRRTCLALSLTGQLTKEDAHRIMVEEARKAGFNPERIGKGCLSAVVVMVSVPLLPFLVYVLVL